MGTLDGPARSVASQLLSQFGTDVTFTGRTDTESGDYDPATGEFPLASDESITVQGTISDYKARFKETQSAEGAKQADFTVTVAASAFEAAASGALVGFSAPETGQRVVFGGRSHEVVHVDPQYSGDQVATYRVHVVR